MGVYQTAIPTYAKKLHFSFIIYDVPNTTGQLMGTISQALQTRFISYQIEFCQSLKINLLS